LPFYGFDFVVDAFKVAVGDAIVVPCEYAVAMARKGVCDAFDVFQV